MRLCRAMELGPRSLPCGLSSRRELPLGTVVVMLRSSLFASLWATGVLCCVAVVPEARQRDVLSELLRSLQNDSAAVRHKGFRELAGRIRTDESLRRRPDVQRALGAFLQAEDRRIKKLVVTEGHAEDYPYLDAYHRELLPSVLEVLPYSSGAVEGELVEAMVKASFNPGSPVARALAAVGEGALPSIEGAAGDVSAVQRSKSYDLLGEMLAAQRDGTIRRRLTPESEARAREALVAGLRDTDIVCRRNAVRGVVRAGERTAVHILKVMADSDPDDGRTGLARNSVRALAAKAVVLLSAQP